MTHAPDISVLLSSHERPLLLSAVLRCFVEQVGVSAEVVVVDDSIEPLHETAGWGHPAVRTIRVTPGTPLGVKLNAAADIARGSVLVKWDDDDFYGSRFLEIITSALTEPSGVCIAFAQPFLLFDLATSRLCRSDPRQCSGATLALPRSTWESIPFPEIPVAVDAEFLLKIVRRYGPHSGRGHWMGREFVQLRHGRNLWNQLPDGRSVTEYMADCAVWPEPIERVVPPQVMHAWRRHQREVSCAAGS